MNEKFQAPIGNVEWKVYTVDQAGRYQPTGAVVMGHTYYEAHRRAAELLGECNLGNVKVEMVMAPNEAEAKHDKKVVQSVVNYTVTVNVSYTSKQEIWKGYQWNTNLLGADAAQRGWSTTLRGVDQDVPSAVGCASARPINRFALVGPTTSPIVGARACVVIPSGLMWSG